MNYYTLISAEELKENLNDPNMVVVDCQFILAEPEQGIKLSQEEHLPGAVFADMNRDLSGKVIPGKTGRNPLPEPEQLARVFSNLGIDETVQVVAYDNYYNAFPGRFWWLLRWLGHQNVAVLDGGISYWKQLGLPTSGGSETRPARSFTPKVQPVFSVLVDEITANPSMLLVDSRGRERYRG